MNRGSPRHNQVKHLKIHATALLLSGLLLVAVVMGSYHPHSDEQDHPDCSICAVAHHHQADSALSHPPALRLPAAYFTLFFTLILAPVSRRLIHPQRNRAPPA